MFKRFLIENLNYYLILNEKLNKNDSKYSLLRSNLVVNKSK